MALYQRHRVSESTLIRPKYGMIRAIYLNTESNKRFDFYNAETATGVPIETIIYDDSSISMPNVDTPFDALYVKVTQVGDSTDDGSVLTVMVD